MHGNENEYVSPCVFDRLFSAPGGPGSQFSRGDFSSAGRFDHNSDEAYGPPSQYKSKYSKPQHYRVREDDSNEQYKSDDDESSFDGAGDYSSYSPFRAPASPAYVPNNNGGAGDHSPRDDDGAYDSDERQQPHSFGNGYAFEFGGANNNNNNGAASPEF